MDRKGWHRSKPRTIFLRFAIRVIETMEDARTSLLLLIGWILQHIDPVMFAQQAPVVCEGLGYFDQDHTGGL